MKPRQVCLLTEDDGMHGLAAALAAAGHKVTILYCGDMPPPAPKDVSLVPLPPAQGIRIGSPAYIRKPYEAYLWLKDQNFDIICYAGRGGYGHYLTIAKRQGLAFGRTLLSAYPAEASDALPREVRALTIGFMERESIAHADAVVDSRLSLEKLVKWFGKVKIHRKSPATLKKTPLVSICITHHDRPHYLKQALASIEKQDYPNFEVVLVDDGSETTEALAYLKELETVFNAKNWKLIRQKNLYQGAAVNAAAKAARGAYIKLMDDDNIARPTELSSFVRAAQATKADIVTCFLDSFSGNEVPADEKELEARWLFVGPAVSVGMFQNGFGDNNALIRRKAFLALGGYAEDYGLSYTDWEFFARAVLKGYRLEVTPQALFWRRQSADSMLNTTNLRKSRMLSLRPYLASVRSELHQAFLLACGMADRNV